MIPKGWREVRLGDICEFLNGYAFRSEHYAEVGIPILSMSNISLTGEFYTPPRGVKYWPESLLDGLERFLVNDGDLVIAMTDVTPQKALIGRMSIVRSTKPMLLNQRVGLIRPNPSLIDVNYLRAFSNSEYWRKYSNKTSDAGAQANLSTKCIMEGRVLLPPPEQEKIAKILSTWDEAIEKIDSLLKAKLKSKSYYVSSMLNPHQNGWKTYRVSDLGEISKGKGIAKSDITEIGIPCITYGEIYTTHHTVIRCFNSHISKETAKESKRLKKGDIVFAGSGETAEEIGKSVAYLRDEEAYVGGDTIILSPSSHSSLFLSYVFNSSYTRKQLNVLGQGNAVVHLYPKALAEVTVALPKVAQQIKIANCLNSLDEEVLVYKQLIEKFKTQKQGLMQQLLTGKKRVKV
jgi:type I restriction enzyme S subunit